MNAESLLGENVNCALSFFQPWLGVVVSESN